ncbi:hypothetical protein HanPI659440_Chr13g0483541 [Helianthus annuus]|nr:hypothetical protein HanPI659440_Chr13g0483541 [Helianthus annuus]
MRKRARIAELEKTVAEQQAQNKTLDLLAQDLGDDCKWLLTRGVPLVRSLVIFTCLTFFMFVIYVLPFFVYIAGRLVRSDELAKYMFDLGGAAYDRGRKDGYAEGKAAALAKEKDDKFELFKMDCTGNYTAKR